MSWYHLCGGAIDFVLDRNSPKGFMGVKWGDDASGAAVYLSLSCEHWKPWEGGQGYEACFDIDHQVDAFGRAALVRLFRSHDRLEGLSLRILKCGATRDTLADSIRREFRLKEDDGSPYTVFADGAVVHLGYDSSDDTCTLTIGGPRFGKAFAEYLLQQGFMNLAHGLRPH